MQRPVNVASQRRSALTGIWLQNVAPAQPTAVMKLSAPRASAPPKATPKRRRAPDPCSVNANTRPVTITATVMSTWATVRDAAQETTDELQLRLPRTLALRLAPEQTGSAWRHSSRRRRSSGSQVVVHSDDRHRACHRRRRGADSLIACGSLDLVRDLANCMRISPASAFGARGGFTGDHPPDAGKRRIDDRRARRRARASGCALTLRER
jgi:hypothetical protein